MEEAWSQVALHQLLNVLLLCEGLVDSLHAVMQDDEQH